MLIMKTNGQDSPNTAVTQISYAQFLACETTISSTLLVTVRQHIA